MTPDRMLGIRKALGLSQRQMSALLRLKGRDERAIRQYERGDHPPSGPAVLLYELLETSVSSRGIQSLNERAAAVVAGARTEYR